MAEIGYIRVSSADQNTSRQLDGVALDERFVDHASAASKDRPALADCIRYARKGDILHVHSIDRLARSLKDLIFLLESFQEKQVTVKFHKENLTFDGTDSPFARLHLQIIGAVAEFERALIRERQREGQQRARKNKQPHTALSPDRELELIERINARYSKKGLAEEFGVSRTTVYNILERHKKREILSAKEAL